MRLTSNFGPQIGCLVARVRVSNGLPVSAGQNEAAARGQLFFGAALTFQEAAVRGAASLEGVLGF